MTGHDQDVIGEAKDELTGDIDQEPLTLNLRL